MEGREAIESQMDLISRVKRKNKSVWESHRHGESAKRETDVYGRDWSLLSGCFLVQARFREPSIFNCSDMQARQRLPF